MAQLQKAPQSMWFYKDEEDKDKGKLVRRFTGLVALGCNDTEYSLCTDAEKQEWINSHREDYPEIFNQENNNENGV
jgi:hypothetical protein